ncbi:cotton fiber protein [Perilla frutescens var. hirtella]|uniref:Cotton fiber protein n=1 Tax=Perilla frutescens var. hirtella TaxID=608512 RepID=A0AAD4IQ07_PERFH|nr:cotton fiber protein [Perilla frutescens var. hirtella]
MIEDGGKNDEVRSMEFRERSGGGAGAEGVKKAASKATDDINESAEAFIRKFKQQLLLQRLDSIEDYHQMLKRGT